MVGHTGVFAAVVKALEKVDSCLEQVVETGKKAGYSFIIIADHLTNEQSEYCMLPQHIRDHLLTRRTQIRKT
jgi:bisphosphoglycerate-independent phosphoglycerate mutase (AlkP superfamily)